MYLGALLSIFYQICNKSYSCKNLTRQTSRRRPPRLKDQHPLNTFRTMPYIRPSSFKKNTLGENINLNPQTTAINQNPHYLLNHKSKPKKLLCWGTPTILLAKVRRKSAQNSKESGKNRSRFSTPPNEISLRRRSTVSTSPLTITLRFTCGWWRATLMSSPCIRSSALHKGHNPSTSVPQAATPVSLRQGSPNIANMMPYQVKVSRARRAPSWIRA